MWVVIKRLTAAAFILVLIAFAPGASAAPYVACPGGYIAEKLDECPDIPKNPVGGPRTGGGGGGGLLGDLLDSVGLGGFL